jgi:hypothetical protein
VTEPTHIPAREVARRRFAFGVTIGLSLLVLFKLWVVHTDDIYASATEYDALWYVGSAKHWYWGAPYSWTAFVRPPAYPLFIAVVHLTGMPLRLAIELLQLTAYLVIVHALRKVAVPNRVCLLVFAAMALHPASFQLNNYTMSDCFYAAVLPLAIGGLLLLLFTGKLKHALWSGAVLAVLWNAREESFLIPLMLAAFLALALWRWRRHKGSWTGAALFWLKPVAALAAVLITLLVAVNTANYFTFQSFAKSEMTSGPYTAAYKALLRIKPEPVQHYVAISNEVIERAFTVSPTFAQLKPQFDGDLGHNWRVPATAFLGHPEYGPWFMWAFRSVAANTGAIHASPASANEFYRQVAREINAACDDGRLASRPVYLSFVDPAAFSFLKYLPESTVRIARLFVRAHEHIYAREDSIITPAQRALYDEMTRRRPEVKDPQTEWNWSDKVSVTVENLIGRGYQFFVIAIAAGALVALVLAVVYGRSRLAEVLPGATLLIGSAVLLRFFFFAFFDATYWTDDYERYLFPIMPLSSAFLILVMTQSIRIWRDGRTRPEVAQ